MEELKYGWAIKCVWNESCKLELGEMDQIDKSCQKVLAMNLKNCETPGTRAKVVKIW